MLSPVEKLRRHVQDLRSKLSIDLSSKENDRIASPSRISRSPHTRNVSVNSHLFSDRTSIADAAALAKLKALSGASSYASTYSEARKAASTLDLPALLRWTDSLSELVTSFEAEDVTAVSPIKGPSEVEFAMLEQERDLLAAEVLGLKEDLTSVGLARSAASA